MDVMKQVFSSLAAHICGMVIAIVAAHHEAHSSECAWYFVAFAFDTTLGVAVTIALHRSTLHAVSSLHVRHPSPLLDAVLQCGNYGMQVALPTTRVTPAAGNPPRLQRWAVQLLEWTACVVLARVVVGSLVCLGNRHPG